MPPRRGTDYERLRESIRMEPDGLPMREVNNWTPDKLALLAYYLGPFAKLCHEKAGGWYFLDGFAGNGANDAREGNTFKGSALIGATITPGARRSVLIEKNSGDADVLRTRCERLGSRAVVLEGDCNELVGGALDEFEDRGLPAFCLFDPYGLELDWEVIELCAGRRTRGTPYELLVYFSTPGVMRTASVTDERMIEGDERAMRRVFGNDRWRPIAERHRSGEIDGRQAWREYLSLYEQQLRELGYRYVMSRPSFMGDRRLAYHLVFASSSEAGQSIMEDGFKRAYGQPRLGL